MICFCLAFLRLRLNTGIEHRKKINQQKVRLWKRSLLFCSSTLSFLLFYMPLSTNVCYFFLVFPPMVSYSLTPLLLRQSLFDWLIVIRSFILFLSYSSRFSFYVLCSSHCSHRPLSLGAFSNFLHVSVTHPLSSLRRISIPLFPCFLRFFILFHPFHDPFPASSLPFFPLRSFPLRFLLFAFFCCPSLLHFPHPLSPTILIGFPSLLALWLLSSTVITLSSFLPPFVHFYTSRNLLHIFTTQGFSLFFQYVLNIYKICNKIYI